MWARPAIKALAVLNWNMSLGILETMVVVVVEAIKLRVLMVLRSGSLERRIGLMTEMPEMDLNRENCNSGVGLYL